MFFATTDLMFGSQTLVEIPIPNLINIIRLKIESFGISGNQAKSDKNIKRR